MSLLGTQVYANPDKPCWLGTAGGTIDGNLLVDGTITATGTISTPGQFIGGTGMVITESTAGGYQMVTSGSALRAKIQHVPAPTNATIISSDDPVVFTRVGVNTGNTSIQTSAFGANLDLLSVGGKLNINSPQVIGTGSIAVGQTNVVIPCTAATAGGKYFLSRTGAPAAGPGNGAGQGGLIVNPAQVVAGVSFRVDLIDPTTGISVAAAGVPATFVWWVLN